MILFAYRVAWTFALPLVRALCAAETMFRAVTSKPLWPAHWRLAERWIVTPVHRDETRNGSETIWLHAASLGECKGLWSYARTLCATLDAHARPARLLLTTNTTTGLDFLQREIAREIARATNPAHARAWHARLAPLDHPRLARRFIDAHGVRALVLFEVELWPHWVAAARRVDVPILWISARLTERARRRYAGNPLFAGTLARVLRDVTWIQTQTAGEEHALRRLSPARAAAHLETGGDLRGLSSLGLGEPNTKAVTSAPENSPRSMRRGIAYVSIHAGELATLFPHSLGATTQNPLFIFPRKMQEVPAFMRVLEPYGFVLHSHNPHASRVIVDAFGLVNDTLKCVRTAVVGGSFGEKTNIGGHNLWEPLLAGCDLVIGPHHANQAYLAARLREHGLLNVVSNDSAHALTNASTAIESPSDETCDDELRQTFIRNERMRLIAAAQRASTVLLKHLSEN